MDEVYKTLYKDAVALQFKFRDLLDGKDHPAGRSLENEIQKLVDEIEMNKNPRSLEGRIKQIQRQLQDTQRQEQPCLDHQHSEFLHDRYEQLRMDLRELPNY